MNCSYCKQPIIRNLTLAELLGLTPIPKFGLCSVCSNLFQRIDAFTSCTGCGRPNHKGLCQDCSFWQSAYPEYKFKNHALYEYDTNFKEWISSYKFSGDYQLRYTFAHTLKKALKPFKRFVICPLPLSFVRIEKRGFNQVEGILEAAEITSIQLLKRIELAPQSDKNRKARLLMPQPYTLAIEKKQITNRSILLVDDVYTTGRTLFHAAEILLSASPKRLETLTLAR